MQADLFIKINQNYVKFYVNRFLFYNYSICDH